jgi:hypothetical protein
MEPPKLSLTGKCPASPPIGGVKGHNMNEISFPGSSALWAGSFKPHIEILNDRAHLQRRK